MQLIQQFIEFELARGIRAREFFGQQRARVRLRFRYRDRVGSR